MRGAAGPFSPVVSTMLPSVCTTISVAFSVFRLSPICRAVLPDRTCPDIEAAFATDVVKTLSAEDPTLATVTVVTSTREWNRMKLHTQ